MKTKYLVRPNDMHIFEIDESNGCYRSYTNRSVTDSDGNRPNAYEHFTYENLTQNYYFFPIGDVDEIDIYEYFHNIYMKFTSWQSRPDGHGGRKGGTFIDFLRYYDLNK